jgi:hypothetical protein
MTLDPVDNGYLSTVHAHSQRQLPEPNRPVIPMLHTLYDYEERF